MRQIHGFLSFHARNYATSRRASDTFYTFFRRFSGEALFGTSSWLLFKDRRRSFDERLSVFASPCPLERVPRSSSRRRTSARCRNCRCSSCSVSSQNDLFRRKSRKHHIVTVWCAAVNFSSKNRGSGRGFVFSMRRDSMYLSSSSRLSVSL